MPGVNGKCIFVPFLSYLFCIGHSIFIQPLHPHPLSTPSIFRRRVSPSSPTVHRSPLPCVLVPKQVLINASAFHLPGMALHGVDFSSVHLPHLSPFLGALPGPLPFHTRADKVRPNSGAARIPSSALSGASPFGLARRSPRSDSDSNCEHDWTSRSLRI